MICERRDHGRREALSWSDRKVPKRQNIRYQRLDDEQRLVKYVVNRLREDKVKGETQANG